MSAERNSIHSVASSKADLLGSFYNISDTTTLRPFPGPQKFFPYGIHSSGGAPKTPLYPSKTAPSPYLSTQSPSRSHSTPTLFSHEKPEEKRPLYYVDVSATLRGISHHLLPRISLTANDRPIPRTKRSCVNEPEHLFSHSFQVQSGDVVSVSLVYVCVCVCMEEAPKFLCV